MIDIRHVYRRRRLDRHSKSAAGVIEAMKRGATLHLTYTRYGPKWSLSPSGRAIPGEVAAHVTLSALVISDGDSLFRDVQAQSFRYRFARGTPTRAR